MGKKRVTQLLDQLKENRQQELQNAASIFTVAQVAVNELQANESRAEASSETKTEPAIAALPSAPILLDKAELLGRYGSYNGCRKAAKDKGIKFSRSPSWNQLITAFSYFEACQQLIHAYVETHTNRDLKGVSIELKLY